MKTKALRQTALAALWVSLVLSTARPALAQDVHAVFVHGLGSGPETWDGASERLKARLSIVRHQPGLSWRSTFESQGSELQGNLWWLSDPTVAIGHSNGGLVSRQWSRLRPLNGIVTLGTPNQGAPLAYNMLSWLGFNFTTGTVITDLFNAFGYNCCEWSWIFADIVNAADLVRYWLSVQPAAMAVTLGIEFGAPVLGEMASSSPAHLNSPENLAREAAQVPARVGITVVAHNFYWAGPFRAVWPQYGDDIAWWMYRTRDILSYYGSYIALTADPGDTRAMDLVTWLWSAAAWIEWIDPTWCNYVSTWGGYACAPNDTVVPEWSQVYPGATWYRIPGGGPAHTQETSQSDDVLYTVLTNYMSVPPRSSDPPGGAGPPGGGSTSLVVSLRADNGQYVVAENGGGWVVNANRDAIGPWETFNLIDLDGGSLRDGDFVAFQASSGHYLQAVDGGGGTMLAIGPRADPWETFILVDRDRPGGVVQSWDAIALQSHNGYFVVAEYGGGNAVNVNREWIGPYETFRLVVH
jgi:hypothetical protein